MLTLCPCSRYTMPAAMFVAVTTSSQSKSVLFIKIRLVELHHPVNQLISIIEGDS